MSDIKLISLANQSDVHIEWALRDRPVMRGLIMNIRIDQLADEQQHYFSSWEKST